MLVAGDRDSHCIAAGSSATLERRNTGVDRLQPHLADGDHDGGCDRDEHGEAKRLHGKMLAAAPDAPQVR
jgi:hypothetical protein